MSKLKTLRKILKNDPKNLFKVLGDKKLFNWMSDKVYLKIIYYCEMGKKLDLEHPETYNEKLQ